MKRSIILNTKSRTKSCSFLLLSWLRSVRTIWSVRRTRRRCRSTFIAGIVAAIVAAVIAAISWPPLLHPSLHPLLQLSQQSSLHGSHLSQQLSLQRSLQGSLHPQACVASPETEPQLAIVSLTLICCGKSVGNVVQTGFC